jgi:hypothetical protein
MLCWAVPGWVQTVTEYVLFQQVMCNVVQVPHIHNHPITRFPSPAKQPPFKAAIQDHLPQAVSIVISQSRGPRAATMRMDCLELLRLHLLVAQGFPFSTASWGIIWVARGDPCAWVDGSYTMTKPPQLPLSLLAPTSNFHQIKEAHL